MAGTADATRKGRKMLTAAQARELAGPTVQEKVEALLVSIEEAAKNKRRSIRTSWEHKLHDELWVSGGYGRTEEWEQAKKMLEDLGYKVTFYYYGESQFVDMYTVVEW